MPIGIIATDIVRWYPSASVQSQILPIYNRFDHETAPKKVVRIFTARSSFDRPLLSFEPNNLGMGWTCEQCGVEGDFATTDGNKCDWGMPTPRNEILAGYSSKSDSVVSAQVTSNTIIRPSSVAAHRHWSRTGPKTQLSSLVCQFSKRCLRVKRVFHSASSNTLKLSGMYCVQGFRSSAVVTLWHQAML